MGRKVPLRCSVWIHRKLLRPFSDSLSTHSGEYAFPVRLQELAVPDS
jgi:hypothetical protein